MSHGCLKHLRVLSDIDITAATFLGIKFHIHGLVARSCPWIVSHSNHVFFPQASEP